ncbi:hypothetical protein D3C84_903530 [compost metagenome]
MLRQNRAAQSAARRPSSEWPKLISNWPGPNSAVITVASIPCARAVSTISSSTGANRDRRSMCMFGWSSASPVNGSRANCGKPSRNWLSNR